MFFYDLLGIEPKKGNVRAIGFGFRVNLKESNKGTIRGLLNGDKTIAIADFGDII